MQPSCSFPETKAWSGMSVLLNPDWDLKFAGDVLKWKNA